MAASTRGRSEHGRRYAVVSVAASEAFPSGALEGARLHWGAALGQYRGWQAVPAGWSTEPAQTSDAGAAPYPAEACFRGPFQVASMPVESLHHLSHAPGPAITAELISI